MRCYGSFLIRCWQSIDDSGPGALRVEIQHLQSGHHTHTGNLIDAADWLATEWEHFCDQRLSEAALTAVDEDLPAKDDPWHRAE